jgi:t-SNARE complex subunit (syntaxin)
VGAAGGGIQMADEVVVVDDNLRQQLAYIQQAINDARLAAYGNVRSYRNLLVLVFFVLLLILIAFPLVLQP